MKARAAEEEVFAASSTSFTVEAVQQAQPIAEIAAQSCCASQADTAAAAGLPGIPPAGVTALLVRQGWADEPGPCVVPAFGNLPGKAYPEHALVYSRLPI